MIGFTFKVLDAEGKVVEGSMVASSYAEAMGKLNETYGNNVLLLQEKADTPRQSASYKMRRSPKVSIDALANYTRQLAVMISSGIPINRAVRFAAKGEDENLNAVMLDVAQLVEEGNSLGKSLNEFPRVFDQIYCALVTAGEESGALEITLEKLADLQEKIVKMRKRVFSTFTYPAVIGVVALGVIGLFCFHIFPEMIPIFTSIGMDLPWPTKALIVFTDIITDPKTAIPLMIGTVVGVSAMVMFLRNLDESSDIRHALDSMLLKIPVMGNLLKNSAASRVLYTLGNLLDSGLSLTEAMKTIEKVAGNAVFARRLQWAREKLTKGAGLSECLREFEVFDEMVLQMISVGEETGRVGDMTVRVAKLLEEEVDNDLDQLAALMEPMMMAIMGAAVGFVVIAAFMPMVELVKSI